MADTTFTKNEWSRYTRHIQLPQIGATGQSQLKQARVLIVGAGGLGSPVSLYLAAAGIGYITIIDGDHIDLSNLQRQILFTTEQIGQSKARCAKQSMQALNPDINIEAIGTAFNKDNADKLVNSHDLIMDCTDNFQTRYLINDTCIRYKKPWIFASIFQFSGQCALFTPDNACFRCLFPDYPNNIENCNSAGVIGVLPGLLGTLQANEAIKYLAGLPCPLNNHLMMVEAIDLSFRRIQLAHNNNCLSCGSNKQAINTNLTTACQSILEDEISSTDFNSRSNDQDIVVIDVRSHAERQAFHIGGTHIPLDELEASIKQLDKTKQIICYCQTGKRSYQASQLLKSQGFNCKSLQAGLSQHLK